ncbi:MAG: hypothetical protein ACKOAY_09785, partial [Haliscomenobacter sp.]
GTERHLFVAGLDGSGFRQLTQGAGTHQTTLSPGATYFADAFSSVEVYNAETAQVYDYYARQNKSYKIEGIGSVDEIFERLCSTVDALGV